MSSPKLEFDSDAQQSQGFSMSPILHNVAGSERTVALDPYLIDQFEADDPDNPQVSFFDMTFLGYLLKDRARTGLEHEDGI